MQICRRGAAYSAAYYTMGLRAFQCICIRPGDRSRQCVKPASSSIMAGAVPGASAPAAQAHAHSMRETQKLKP